MNGSFDLLEKLIILDDISTKFRSVGFSKVIVISTNLEREAGITGITGMTCK
jgi:hypothetical protein